MKRDNDSIRMNELRIEEIARINNVVGADSGFVASDNIDSPAYLSQDYIDSIGNFKVGSPFKIRFTMMLFCLRGEMDVQLNLVSHTLRAGEMLMVHEGTVAVGQRMDPDIRLFIMGFTRAFISTLPPSVLISKFLASFLDSSFLAISEDDMNDILSVYRLIKRRLTKDGFELKRELIWSGLQAIGCIISDSIAYAPSTDRGMTRKQMMMRDFIRLVGRYGASQRDIPFYARKLCVSAKYLGQVVTEVSGETPRKWICRQVILEAKALLDDPTLTIQQVSEMLNFANQSFFGTFFRKQTGISPKDYRMKKT
ncbi:MAG: helix-turn-helix domain-containing protein [Muribaculaceae bacterium]|nr:helix-turn-helix domain-containing protein [Muribaculaceae bacterium]